MILLVVWMASNVFFKSAFANILAEGDLSLYECMAGVEGKNFGDSVSDQLSELTRWLAAEKMGAECPIPSGSVETGAGSTCPWEEVVTTDLNRIPVNISRAVCRCNGCHDFNLNEVSTSLGICQEVIKPTIVYRRESPDSDYFMDVEMVPRACHCNTTITNAYSASFASLLQQKERNVKGDLESLTQDCPNETRERACPWNLVRTKDGNRIPKNIWWAVCECEQCMEPTADGSVWKCEEVITPTRVARRKNRESPFYLDVEMVPTACTCRKVV